MAFNPVPTTWLAGWSEDGTNITVPIATFPELTAAEADAATGDIRKILFAIIDKLREAYNALPAADRPVQVTVSRTSFENATDQLVRSYTFQFVLESAGLEVDDEPA